MQPEVKKKIAEILSQQSYSLQGESPQLRMRIEHELAGLGPIESLLQDDSVSEILVNGKEGIFFETGGRLAKLDDSFYSENSYLAALDRLAQSCGTYLSREKPFIEAQFENLRISMVFGEIARGHNILSIRKQPAKARTLEEFLRTGSCSPAQMQLLRHIFQSRANFLVTGSTSSGKTSLLQALINSAEPFDRFVILEDTRELQLPNECSVSLLTRADPARQVPDVNLDDLLKRALRLRPDRLVVGEIRGAEATSLLLALSTGHDGSCGSLHARTASEALLRLEMLIQMGAPQWNLHAVRRLISLSIKNIIVLEKNGGTRKVSGIFELGSVEETGLTLQRVDE
jgi:pilus assembly protein CpaF